MTRLGFGALSLVVGSLVETSAAAQTAPQTRADVIRQERQEKEAELWPERQSPFVNQVNALVERGFDEGLESGQGADGPQIVLGGMRSGQGFSAGVGYRRKDLWRDRLSYRATARGTINQAYMVDFDLDVQALRSERSYANWYTKYESSPRMDYYGQGNSSKENDRTSYLFDDLTSDVNAAFEPVHLLRLGLTGGFIVPYVGSGHIGGVPSIEERFNAITAPGLGEDPTFARWGTFVYFDNRDPRSGPRSGGLYGARFRQYADFDFDRFSFRQAEFEAQHYLPYFNKMRVIALRGAVVLSFPREGNIVPFYLQPTLGGNDNLRGFPRYRFTGNNSVLFSVEHRWFGVTALDMAVFIDAGKVVDRKAEVDFSNLNVDAGIGFRVRVRDTIVTRIDFAVSREGFRAMWTFSDIYRVKWWAR